MDNSLMSGPAVSSLVRRGLSPNLLMGNPTPLTSGITPGAPTYDPSMQQPQSPPMPDRNPMAGVGGQQPAPPPGAPPPPQAAPQEAPQQQKFMPVNEAEHIVQALTKRLDSLNKLTQKPGVSDAKEMESFEQKAIRIKQEYMDLITAMRGNHDYIVPQVPSA